MMFRKIAIFLLPVFLYGCMPSSQLINLNDSDRVAFLNQEVKNKMVKINLNEGNSIESSHVKFSSDSLFYSNSFRKSVDVKNIKSIVVSPKTSFSTIAAFSLFGLGAYFILTADKREGWDSLGAIFGGVGLIVIGSGVIIVGNNIESEIYYFNKTN